MNIAKLNDLIVLLFWNFTIMNMSIQKEHQDIIKALSFELKLTEMTDNFVIYKWGRLQTKRLSFPNYVELARNTLCPVE